MSLLSDGSCEIDVQYAHVCAIGAHQCANKPINAHDTQALILLHVSLNVHPEKLGGKARVLSAERPGMKRMNLLWADQV